MSAVPNGDASFFKWQMPKHMRDSAVPWHLLIAGRKGKVIFAFREIEWECV